MTSRAHQSGIISRHTYILSLRFQFSTHLTLKIQCPSLTVLLVFVVFVLCQLLSPLCFTHPHFSTPSPKTSTHLAPPNHPSRHGSPPLWRHPLVLSPTNSSFTSISCVQNLTIGWWHYVLRKRERILKRFMKM